MKLCLTTDPSVLLLLTSLTRLYPKFKNKLTTGLFLDKFSEFLQDCAISKGDLVTVGDLNLHLDVVDDPDTRKFNQMLESLGLIQSVVGLTYRDGIGPMLDVVHV